jgi:plasmid stabilization system protein ParE
MTRYAFHPEARVDLDEIWEFIRSDNLDAADRVIAEILSAISRTVPFPNQGHKRPDLTQRPLRFLLVREYRLRAGRRALVGCCSSARTAQPPVDGLYFKRATVNLVGHATWVFKMLAQFDRRRPLVKLGEQSGFHIL